MEDAARAEGELDEDPGPEVESADVLGEQWAAERSALNGGGDMEGLGRLGRLGEAEDSGEDSGDEREVD